MLCQRCNKNEADATFVVNWMGVNYEVHFCQECIQKMWQYTGLMGNPEAFAAYTGWRPDKMTPRELGKNPFSEKISDDVKKRRLLNALEKRLKDAESREAYEEAAKLRDKINSAKEVLAHE